MLKVTMFYELYRIYQLWCYSAQNYIPRFLMIPAVRADRLLGGYILFCTPRPIRDVSETRFGIPFVQVSRASSCSRAKTSKYRVYFPFCCYLLCGNAPSCAFHQTLVTHKLKFIICCIWTCKIIKWWWFHKYNNPISERALRWNLHFSWKYIIHLKNTQPHMQNHQ